jgi:hypothetical protein
MGVVAQGALVVCGVRRQSIDALLLYLICRFYVLACCRVRPWLRLYEQRSAKKIKFCATAVLLVNYWLYQRTQNAQSMKN